MTEAHRITYDLMPPLTYLIMYAILSGFAVTFVYGFYRRLRIYFRGSVPPKFDQIQDRVVRAIVNAFAQRKVVKKTYPAIMHLLIYSGIIVLLIGTTLVMLDSDFWQPLFHQQFSEPFCSGIMKELIPPTPRYGPPLS